MKEIKEGYQLMKRCKRRRAPYMNKVLRKKLKTYSKEKLMTQCFVKNKIVRRMETARAMHLVAALTGI